MRRVDRTELSQSQRLTWYDRGCVLFDLLPEAGAASRRLSGRMFLGSTRNHRYLRAVHSAVSSTSEISSRVAFPFPRVIDFCSLLSLSNHGFNHLSLLTSYPALLTVEIVDAGEVSRCVFRAPNAPYECCVGSREPLKGRGHIAPCTFLDCHVIRPRYHSPVAICHHSPP